jgi:hypothetical protein
MLDHKRSHVTQTWKAAFELQRNRQYALKILSSMFASPDWQQKLQ